MSRLEYPVIDLDGLEIFKEKIEKEIEANSGSLSAPLTASKSVGGITSGKTYPADTGFEEMWRDMLNPVENPSFVAPSAALSTTGGTLLESGSSVSKTFTVEFNRGKIQPSYGTSGYRSGEATGYALNGGTEQQSNTFTETVNASNKTFQASVSYAEGPQPKNSAGQNYSTPLPAGSVNSNTVTFEFVDAIWANTANITTIAKLSLVSKSSKSRELSYPSQTVANPEVFDVPASWTINSVMVYNELSGQWSDCSSEFTITNTTHNDAAGNSVAYKRYTDNRSYAAGPRKLKISFS